MFKSFVQLFVDDKMKENLFFSGENGVSL